MAKLNNKGFSLVEAIVATLIMSLGALLLAGGFIAATRMMDNAAGLQHNGERTAGALDGGAESGTTILEQGKEVRLRIGGHEFTVTGKLQKRESLDDPNIHFYRYTPDP